MHALSAYKNAAESIADDVLGLCADALERRERMVQGRANEKGGDEVSIRDVLRGLSRVIDR